MYTEGGFRVAGGKSIYTEGGFRVAVGKINVHRGWIQGRRRRNQ
jgi:hypothetical protein